MLMNENLHSAFTGTKASISTKVNGKFNVFDGYCHGYNIELVRAKLIVQAWHFDEDGWPADHYSICSFKFDQDGIKTVLTLSRPMYPNIRFQPLKRVGNSFYWEPIKDYLKENRKD